MYVNQVEAIMRSVTHPGGGGFSFDATPTVQWSGPRGLLTSPAVNDLDAPGSTPHRLWAVPSVPYGGRYEARWSWNVGSEDAVVAVDVYWAYWNDVYSMARQAAGRTASTMTDEEVDRGFDVAWTKLAAQFPCLGDYSYLSAADAKLVDYGLAHIVAGAIRRAKSGGQPAGPVVSITKGPDTIRWAAPPAEATVRDPIDALLDDGWSLLCLASCVATSLAASFEQPIMAVASGRDAAAEAIGSPLAPRYALFNDVLLAYGYGGSQ